MAHEIETKVLDIDAEAFKKKIISLGGVKTQETRLTVDWYRQKGVKEGEDPWFLRIRSNSEGKHEVTWKAKSDILGTARKHKEINFFIAEPEKLADLFLELGLEKYAHQDKDRVSFDLKDWHFDLDQYPKMPAYLEIEGKSEAHVNEAIKLLGLSKHKTWAKGERILIQEIYGLDWYQMEF
jgi:adenylate cyclase class 2